MNFDNGIMRYCKTYNLNIINYQKPPFLIIFKPGILYVRKPERRQKT